MSTTRDWWLCAVVLLRAVSHAATFGGRDREFIGDMAAPGSAAGGGSGRSHQQWNDAMDYSLRECQPIPQNLSVCHNVEYRHMVLPNYFQHERLGEAVTQASVWLPLLKMGCHRDLGRFLCSLYAPVCVRSSPNIDILPCRSLCTAVQQPCAAVMRNFNFSWPSQLTCDNFPDEDTLCVPVTQSGPQNEPAPGREAYSSCPLCNIATTANKDTLLQSFCQADIVLKATIRQITTSGEVTLHLGKKVVMFKKPPGSSSNTISSIQGCSCPQSTQSPPLTRGKWFIAGRRSSNNAAYEILYIFPWDREQKEFKQTIRRIRRQGKELCNEPGISKSTPSMSIPLMQPVEDNTNSQPERKRKGGPGGGGKRQKQSNNGR